MTRPPFISADIELRVLHWWHAVGNATWLSHEVRTPSMKREFARQASQYDRILETECGILCATYPITKSN